MKAKKEKTLALSSAMAELVVNINEREQLSGNGKEVGLKEVAEKDVSECTFPLDESKK